MSFIDIIAHEYGWNIEYILSLPYVLVRALSKAIAERKRRELAELVLCIHPKDPQELFSELTGDKTKSKSLDELRKALSGSVIPVEVVRRGNRKHHSQASS